MLSENDETSLYASTTKFFSRFATLGSTFALPTWEMNNEHLWNTAEWAFHLPRGLVNRSTANRRLSSSILRKHQERGPPQVPLLHLVDKLLHVKSSEDDGQRRHWDHTAPWRRRRLGRSGDQCWSPPWATREQKLQLQARRACAQFVAQEDGTNLLAWWSWSTTSWSTSPLSTWPVGVKYHLNKAPTCPARGPTEGFPAAPPTVVAPRAALMAAGMGALRGFQQALDPPEGLPWLLPILSSQWFAINWDFLLAIWNMICEIDYCICRFRQMLFLHQKSQFLEPFPNNVFKTLWYQQSIEIILITAFHEYQNYYKNLKITMEIPYSIRKGVSNPPFTFHWYQNYTIIIIIRYALKKKRYYLGIFPKRRPPPLLGSPYPKKNLVFILHFRT